MIKFLDYFATLLKLEKAAVLILLDRLGSLRGYFRSLVRHLLALRLFLLQVVELSLEVVLLL